MASASATWRQLWYAIGSAAALGTTDLIITLTRPDSLGLGDVILAPAIGLILDWFHPAAVLNGLIVTVTIGIAAVAVLLIAKRIRRHQAFAHGPVMLAGALMAYLQIA